MTGPDVILVHRLAKGTSGEVIGKPAFAVYTEATLNKMSMDPSILGFAPHTESFDGIGEVGVFVQDLSVRWAFEQERNRDYVTSEQAILEVKIETPAPPPVVWTHLTDPSRRIVWQSATTSIQSVTGGRAGAGSVNHCMHGPDLIIEHVSDWRPFSYITCRYDIGEAIDQWAWTTQLDENDEGTTATIRLSDPGTEIWDAIGEQMIAQLDLDRARLSEMLLEAVQTENVG